MSTPRQWYVVNVADAPTVRHSIAGTLTRFESPEDPFQEVGVNLRVLEPGQPSTIFHAENSEEHFLVLSGRCMAIIGSVERELGAWDFLHVPAGVPHTFVGAGEGPCAILMIGARHADMRSFYPVSDLAAAHGASSTEPTESTQTAYAGWSEGTLEPTQLDWPPRA
ncbi:MAG: cupin domain-containing protein [Solirubrobacteraceae bacterium]|nr:cupin domain-containing protein [Solirubrobacteraceae bacterium]